ncbi:LysR substrate-binding domain-containing protein [Sphingomonas sp.]|uniref:LysR substrate-binding domain-containing protein n=1 Tax=Sphingomonas sp. TaxID=28214 RepID=UPI000DB59B6A|nr:LysR substrate-binding domain-containing protein [Sphingomonas sp.]PZU06500.1 MAG: hypothetical protein DI605_18800 [Sphingomonas sp.]
MARLPPLTALRALEAAGRYVNFSRAAEELNVTPGAISRQIRLLESYLGMHLFDRSQAKLQLTERSAEYVKALTDAFTRLDLATQRLLNDRRERQLNIACSMTFALRWLVPRLPRFYESHPGLEVKLSLAPHPNDAFDLTDVDMAIVVNERDRIELVSEKLMDNELLVVGRSDRIEALPEPRIPLRLAKETLLSSDLRPRDWEHWFDAVADGEPVPAFTTTNFASSTLVYQAAQTGLGFAIARLPLVLDDIENGSLQPVYPIVLADPNPYCMIYSKVSESPRLRMFRSWLRSEADRFASRTAAHTGHMARITRASPIALDLDAEDEEIDQAPTQRDSAMPDPQPESARMQPAIG